MTIRFHGVAFDAADAATTATFWGAVLGRPLNDDASVDHATVDATTPNLGPRISFHRVPEPKTVKNRFHPDLVTDDLDAETKRLVALGATIINEVTLTGARWLTLADPEGNEFDLIAG